MKRFFRGETVGFASIWLLLILFGRVNLCRDPGTFWHISLGQQILSSQHLPSADIYSFTCPGHPWLDHEWLMECCMALIYGPFGFDGLLLAFAAALAGTPGCGSSSMTAATSTATPSCSRPGLH